MTKIDHWFLNKLKNIFEALKKVYLGPIGFEYMHIRNHEVIEWFKEKAERNFLMFNPEIDEKMIELILNMSGEFFPAENAQGQKVEQELVVSFGLMGC